MKRILLAFFLACATLSSAALPGPTSATFAKGAPFTVAGYTGNETLSGFPVLVRIAENSPQGFSYDDLQSKSTGDDIAFVDMTGAGIPFEIDTWNPNGTSLVWVRLPTMTNGTQFVMCWGSDASGKTVCNANPWSDYTGVWHMNETTAGVTTIHDSTANGLDGTSVASSDTKADGAVGRARFITSNTNNKSGKPYDSGVTVDMTDDPDKLAAVDAIVPEFTASFWVRPQNNAQWWYFITRKAADLNPGWGLQNGSDGNNSSFKVFRAYGSTETDSQCMNLTGVNGLVKGTWTKIDAVWMADKAFKLYVNGILAKEGTLVNAAENGDQTKLGIGGSMAPPPLDQNLGDRHKNGRGVYGDMDEVRLAAGAATADRIAADYATQTDPAFLTAGMAEPYGESDDPLAAVSVASFAYTNATVSAIVSALGTDATSANVTVQVSATADFASPVWTTNYAVSAAPDSRSFDVTGLSTGTVYRVRAAVTNSVGAGIVSSVPTFTTRAPGAPAGTAAFLARGFTTMMASATTTSFGVGAVSATMRLEASADADFATVVAGAETNAVTGAAADLSVPGLAPGTAYHLRVRLRNDWGLDTFLALPDAATPAVPLESTGIGYTWSPDGSTIDFTFGVSTVYDGATCTAELSYGGAPQGSRMFSLPGSLTWPGVAAASAARPVAVTVTAVVDGTTYTETWTATVSPGSHAYAVSTLAELSSIALRVGDTVSLPSLARANDYYLPLDVRVLSLEEDGRTLKAIEPGFSAVCAMEWDAAAGAFVRNAAMGLAVCIPAAAGRVFLAEAGGADMNWSATAKWRCLSDPTVTGEYPDGAGDVAMVPLAKDKAITLDVDATVGAVYAGWDASAPAAGTVYFRATNRTLTFDTGAVDEDRVKVPGLFRVTGLSRTDVNTDRPTFTFGANNDANRLSVALPNGLVVDGGKCPDYADKTLRENHNRLRFVNGSVGLSVPADATLRFDNFDHSGGWGDSQMWNCAALRCGTRFQILGEGKVIYDAAACGYFEGAFKDFSGTFLIRQRERYANVGVDSRGGGFWLRANTGYEAKNATFVIDGESDYSNAARNALGLATYGSTHGSGAWGPGDNSFGGKAMVMAGGVLVHRGNNNSGWANNGIFNIPNRSDALVVSNGYSVIDAYNYQAATVAVPTNRMEFASLRHANRGTLRVSTTDTANYSQAARTSSSHCIVHNAEGFAIGAGGADGSYKESVIPWIVSEQQWSNRIYFPYLGTRDGETNCLVLYKHPTTKSSLADATDPDENVFVYDKPIALTEDVTVNALYLNNIWEKGTALGAGRTLTVTSGGVILEGERCAIGQESDFTAGTAGTLRLPNEGYLYSTVQSAAEPNEVWAAIVAPKGLAISFPGYFRMGGDQTGIDEELAINGCDVTLGSETTGCTIDVPVRLESGAAKLRIGKAGSFCRQDLYLNDHAGSGPKFVPAAGTEESVHKLFVDGKSMPRGYYGSSEAADAMSALATRNHPAFVDDNHFVGTGWIKVLADDLLRPSLMILR